MARKVELEPCWSEPLSLPRSKVRNRDEQQTTWAQGAKNALEIVERFGNVLEREAHHDCIKGAFLQANRLQRANVGLHSPCASDLAGLGGRIYAGNSPAPTNKLRANVRSSAAHVEQISRRQLGQPLKGWSHEGPLENQSLPKFLNSADESVFEVMELIRGRVERTEFRGRCWRYSAIHLRTARKRQSEMCPGRCGGSRGWQGGNRVRAQLHRSGNVRHASRLLVVQSWSQRIVWARLRRGALLMRLESLR